MSKFDFKLYLNSNDFVNTLFLMHSYHLQYVLFMIPNLVYISKNLYTSNQVRLRLIYLLGLEATGLHTSKLCHLDNILTDEADIPIREKS